MIEITDIRSHEEMVAAYFDRPSCERHAALDSPTEARIREVDMTWAVLGSMDELWSPRKQPDWISAEVPTASSVADLAVIKFDASAIERRLAEHAAPVELPLRVKTLDALAHRRINQLSTLARTVGSNPRALTRSTIRPLEELGWIRLEGDRVELSRDWQSVGTEVMTVEMKISDWRGALVQARSQALSADRVWVVLPEKSDRVVASALPEFRAEGIGLAFLRPDGTIRLIAAARKQSPIRWLNFLLAETLFGQCQASRPHVIAR
ncbi:MAG: hypothetical protein ACRDKE_09125 [Solirubrobacterales bacterium]